MKEKNADKNPQLVLRKVCSGLSVISPPKKGSDKNAQLSTCKAELEAMRQRLAVAVGNCSLLESMVERRDQTIEGLRERVRQLEERQTDAELREELREVHPGLCFRICSSPQASRILILVISPPLGGSSQARRKFPCPSWWSISFHLPMRPILLHFWVFGNTISKSTLKAPFLYRREA